MATNIKQFNPSEISKGGVVQFAILYTLMGCATYGGQMNPYQPTYWDSNLGALAHFCAKNVGARRTSKLVKPF